MMNESLKAISPYLTVIVPVFNEATTILIICERVAAEVPEGSECLLVDDASTDQTLLQLSRQSSDRFTIMRRPANGGKTAAVRDGLEIASGKYVIVQDADLEYDPADIPRLLAVAQAKGGAVYGRRPSLWRRPSRWVLASGVLLIDVWLLLLYRRWVRDHATCYKLMPTHVLRGFDLQSTGFEGCVEITAKLMRAGVPIYQVPISYQPRSAKDGKKLTWRYGWTALKAAWRWRNWVPEEGSGRRASEAAETHDHARINETAVTCPDSQN